MKNFFKIFLFFSFFANLSFGSVEGEVHGYFRAGAGENVKGGKVDCYKNKGAFGPEFRLGNECSIYGELKFQKNFLQEPQEKSQFQVGALFAFSRNGNTDWEDGDVAIRELYSEAQNLDASGYSYWVGKRYLRWSDVYILDWYPLQFNGMGAGVSNTISNWSTFLVVESGATVSSEIGAPTKSSLHWRKDNLELFSDYKLDTWIAAASTRDHQITVTTSGTPVTTSYDATQGALLGLKLKGPVFSSFADVGVIFGHGNLADLQPSGVSVQKSAVERAFRSTFFAQLNFEKKDRISGQAIFAIDRKDSGTGGIEEWSSIGVQPVYEISNHFQWTSVLGYSGVKVTNTNDKTLFRFALGPQVSVGKGFWSRPVLRALVSYHQWNQSNGSSFSSNTATLGQDHALGVLFQTEAWF